MIIMSTISTNNQTGNKVPAEIKRLAFAPEIYKQTEEIGKKFGLHIDQIGELDAELIDIFLGNNTSSKFVSDITERLEIDEKLATEIGKEVNEKIFLVLRDKLQTQTQPQQSMADLERVGGFTIEPTGQNGNGNGGGAVPANLPGAEVVTESKEDLLSGIEDPATIPPKSAALEENHTDILVDHLLANSTGAAEEKIAKPVEIPASMPIAQEVPKKAPTADSYREPIE